MSPIVGALVEKRNNRPIEEQPAWRKYLKLEYTPDLRFDSATFNDSVVRAEIVAMNSSLPLKSRGALGVASGKLPKVGMAYKKEEDFFERIDAMKNKGMKNAVIAGKLLEDVPNILGGFDAFLDYGFLQGLSTGVGLIPEEDNPENGARIDFGYKDEHTKKVGSTKKWSGAKATPISDLEELCELADKESIKLTHFYMSKKTFNQMRKSQEAKSLFATANGMNVSDETKIATPTKSQFLEILEDEFGAKFTIFDLSVTSEGRDGKKVAKKPFEDGVVIGRQNDEIGRVVWGDTVEATHKVNSVEYATADFVLISKYSETNPLVEYTAGQAKVIPVIDDGANTFVLKTEE